MQLYGLARKGLIAGAALAATLAIWVPSAGAQGVDGTNFRSENEGTWYHPLKVATWMHIGGEPEVIQEVLSAIAEADGERLYPDMPHTLIADGPGDWITEWTAAGDRAMEEAHAALSAGDKQMAKRKFRAATSYYLRASSPNINEPLPLAALEKAQAAYREAGALLPRPLQVVEVPFEAGPSWPTCICLRAKGHFRSW